MSLFRFLCSSGSFSTLNPEKRAGPAYKPNPRRRGENENTWDEH
jgi:hypothetical protein